MSAAALIVNFKCGTPWLRLLESGAFLKKLFVVKHNNYIYSQMKHFIRYKKEKI